MISSLEMPFDLATNLESVRQRISRAAERAGRKPEDIKLAAVTKTVPPERIREALHLGLNIFGENKVQEALPKIETLRDAVIPAGRAMVEWHFIGHLQTNKAAKAVEYFEFVQSVDSVRLAEDLNRKAEELNKVQQVLCEVKLSPEATKFGVDPDAVERFLEACSSLQNLRVRGLMTMAPYTQDVKLVRQIFRQARQLFERQGEFFDGQGILSMGMSDDFEIAVEEGSTMVRIGRALFGAREIKT